jgi:hypothetical protein
MIKKTMLACALVAMIPAAAMAQPDGDATGDGSGGGSGDAGGGGTAAGDAGAAASGAMATTGTGPEIFQKGTMGLAFALPSGGFTPAGTINLTYFANDKTAYDLILGLHFAHTPDQAGPPPVAGGDILGFTVGFGYRMYKHHSAKIHTFLEPQVLIADADMTNAFADSLSISVGAGLGAECMFTDWFSVSGQVGAGLAFSQKFKSIDFSTGTSGLYANLYWK